MRSEAVASFVFCSTFALTWAFANFGGAAAGRSRAV